jgi:hypothetical protein
LKEKKIDTLPAGSTLGGHRDDGRSSTTVASEGWELEDSKQKEEQVLAKLIVCVAALEETENKQKGLFFLHVFFMFFTH